MTEPNPTLTHHDLALVTADHSTVAGDAAAADGPFEPPGYELLEEVGAGGMGVVYRARDLGLNREVAIKVLSARYPVDSAAAVRFVEEAQITAQLQHPSIPAVHQVGRSPDGRPFLAMKLIKGRTLDLMLKAGTVNTLAVFEAVAQAVGFAHAQQIIHRDLKPTNIMVGSFGEVQVMDWGLAKLVRPPGSPSADPPATNDTFVPPAVRFSRSPDSSETQAGSVVGTLAFMPPEQAAGEIDHVNQRSDVFGLGAILCTLLTGQPPYTATGTNALLAAAVRGDTADALRRLDECGAEPSVVALCKKCLSFNPDDRPADGHAVATAVARIRSDAAELARQAEVDRARSEVAAAEARKRRRTKRIALAVTFAVFAVGIVGTTVGYIRADRAREKAEAAERGEAEQREKAQDRLRKAVDAVEKIMARVSSEKWWLKRELQDERREMIAEAVAFFQGFDETESRDPYVRRQTARAYMLTMSAYMALAEYDNCGKAAESAHELYRALVAEDPQDAIAQRGMIDCLAMRGHLGAIAGRYAQAEHDYEAGLAAAEAAAATIPASEELQVAVADMNTSLGLFNGMRRADRMVRYHEAALRIGEQLLRNPSPGYRARMVVFTSLINLAANKVGHQPQVALEMFRRAETQLPFLEGQPAPSARAAESFLVARASLNVYGGALTYRVEARPEGITRVRTGVRQMKQLLELYPKSFPILVHWMEYQVVLADLLVRSHNLTEAEDVFTELDRKREQLLSTLPQAAWLARIGTAQRSGLVVEFARIRPPAEVIRQTVKLLESEAMLNAADGMSGDVVRYNAACVYAQLAARAEPAEALFHAHKAIELLNGMKNRPYLQEQRNVVHLDRDTDLNPLRDYPGYKEFRATFPPYREAAPPPRVAP